ncbi:hypothetical protein DFS33DRAFT_1383691 [Desarmillaria ectypa]|nr:hypothetical protein DFS33DRAFT_1383691 [Desarmillaria ectypa]
MRDTGKTLHLGGSPTAFLAATWLNTVFYTSQVALSIYYLHHFSGVPRWVRYWILASLILDGACSITNMAYAYLYLVPNHGHSTFSWPISTAVLLTFTSASIAQTFSCYRHWIIARNRWITGWIICLITANLLASLVAAVCMAVFPKNFMLPIPVTTVVICAATDATITGCLVWRYSHIKSPFLSTRNLVRRVMIQALACGFTTAIPTMLMAIFLFTVWDAFYIIHATLGRIYSLSVLLTLMVLKVMHRSDPSTVMMDDDGVSRGPPVLESIFFKNPSDTDTGNTQLTNETSDHFSTQLQLRNLANDRPFTHTV